MKKIFFLSTLLFIVLLTSIGYAVAPYPVNNPFNATIHWSFDNQDCVDANGNTDCTNNGGFFDASSPFGSGKSLYFNGSSFSYLDTNSNDFFINGPWAICAWF